MPSNEPSSTNGVRFTEPITPEQREILSDGAVAFLAKLVREFGPKRAELLRKRTERQMRIDQGELPTFLIETRGVREGAWTCAPIPKDLMDRRVEITGPTDRKMIINALNCGASVFMADFEDANSPTWKNMIQGQVNLRDTVRRKIDFTSPEGKEYKLKSKTATLMVRPRGWHLEEKHVLIDGKPISASIFDFAVFFYHNAQALVKNGTGPYFYLPKMESHLEARLWNDIFVRSQEELGVPQGTIRATVLIETILAAFEMDEILYELRDHSAGLNCGRWDYIFSFIKKFCAHPGYIFPDRAQVGMTAPFLRAYSKLLIKTCHRRNIHAMGGMAAQIPIKNNPAANDEALAKVRADKEREVTDGHDGTWVAHPDLVGVAKEIFDKHMPGPNQIDKKTADFKANADDLLKVPEGKITEQGLRMNVDIGVHYVEAWLRGQGCVPIYNLMEDAATSEISRAQVWQWIHHKAKMNDGRIVTAELYRSLLREILESARSRLGQEKFEKSKFAMASLLFEKMVTAEHFPQFLTLEAYGKLEG